MGTYRMPPTALLDQTGLTGSLADIDEDPDSGDGNWLTTSNNTSTVCRVSFDTPAAGENLSSGATDQEFRVLLRKTNHSTDPTFTVELYESGSLVSTLASGVTLSTTTGQVYSYTWDGDLLTGSEGQNVEFRVSGSPGGGSPGNRASVEVGAVEWNATTVDPPITETHIPPKPAYSMTPLRTDGIWKGLYRAFAQLPGAEFTELRTGVIGEPASYAAFPIEDTDDADGISGVIHPTGGSDRIVWEWSPNGENKWITGVDPPRPVDGITVVALIKTNTGDTTVAGTSIIQRYNGVSGAYPYRIYQVTADPLPDFEFGIQGDSGFRTVAADLAINLDEWYWLVGRWAGGEQVTFSIYTLDGQVHAGPTTTTGSYNQITWTEGDAGPPDSDYDALWGDSSGAYEGSGGAAFVWSRKLEDDELALFFSNPWDFYDHEMQSAGAASNQVNGTGAVTLGGLTVSSAGAVAMEGTGAVTLGGLTVSSAGKVQMDGTGAVTFGALTVSSAGTVLVQGTGGATLGALTVDSAGTVTFQPRTGDGAVTFGALTVSSAGSVQNRGVGDVNLAALTVSGAGDVLMQGTGSVTLGALTTSGTGGSVVSGTGAVTLGALTVSSAGAVQVKGTGGATLGALAISSLGDVLMQGNGNVPLGALTVSSTGKVQMDGTGAVTFGALVISSAGLVGSTVTTGTGAITLGILGVDATGDVLVAGDGAVSLGSLLVASQGVVPVQGTGGALLGALVASGQGEVPMEGVGAITLGAITTYGYDERDQAGGLGYANRSINNAIGIMT